MDGEFWLDFMGRLGILAIFMAGFIFVFYLVRRYMGEGRSGKQKWIRVLSTHYISSKEKLMLVQVPGQVLLVGVTPSRITHLSTLAPDAISEESLAAQKFPGLLGKALSRKGQTHEDE